MRRQGVAVLVLVAAVGVALLDREIGLGRWLRLEADLVEVEGRIAGLRDRIDVLEAESEALRRDDFAIERAIREELGLARPGEIVVRSGPPERTLARRPSGA